MVTGNNSHVEDGDKGHPPTTTATSRGGTRSWGTTVSGQSMSTSGSVGSPSSRSEQAMATPASDNTFMRLNHLDIHGDDAGSQAAVGLVHLSDMLCFTPWVLCFDGFCFQGLW